MDFVEYALAATNTQLQSRSEWKSVTTISNVFKEATGRATARHWRTASDKKIKSLKEPGVYSLTATFEIFSGMKTIESTWVYKMQADGTHKACRSPEKESGAR